ncbi:MAG: hypothetical protein GC159_11550 [Phycisphaera sp.]|nr:hypothetical protein [Phycisphaera sp.]
MDNTTLIDSLSDLFNSGLGFALIWALLVGLFIWLSSAFNPFEEKWKQWEGSIITGIKLAEKQIPDDTPNAGLAKLDAALRFVLKAYADANNGKQPPTKLIGQIKQGIQIKHADLDRYGGLSSKS